MLTSQEKKLLEEGNSAEITTLYRRHPREVITWVARNLPTAILELATTHTEPAKSAIQAVVNHHLDNYDNKILDLAVLENETLWNYTIIARGHPEMLAKFIAKVSAPIVVIALARLSQSDCDLYRADYKSLSYRIKNPDFIEKFVKRCSFEAVMKIDDENFQAIIHTIPYEVLSAFFATPDSFLHTLSINPSAMTLEKFDILFARLPFQLLPAIDPTNLAKFHAKAAVINAAEKYLAFMHHPENAIKSDPEGFLTFLAKMIPANPKLISQPNEWLKLLSTAVQNCDEKSDEYVGLQSYQALVTSSVIYQGQQQVERILDAMCQAASQFNLQQASSSSSSSSSSSKPSSPYPLMSKSTNDSIQKLLALVAKVQTPCKEGHYDTALAVLDAAVKDKTFSPLKEHKKLITDLKTALNHQQQLAPSKKQVASSSQSSEYKK